MITHCPKNAKIGIGIINNESRHTGGRSSSKQRNSKNGVASPLRLQIGSIKSNVPTRIKIKSLKRLPSPGCGTTCSMRFHSGCASAFSLYDLLRSTDKESIKMNYSKVATVYQYKAKYFYQKNSCFFPAKSCIMINVLLLKLYIFIFNIPYIYRGMSS